MFTPKTALFTFAATCALAMVACQPAEGPAEQAAGRSSVDNKTAGQVGRALDADDKATDKVRDTAKSEPRPTPQQ